VGLQSYGDRILGQLAGGNERALSPRSRLTDGHNRPGKESRDINFEKKKKKKKKMKGRRNARIAQTWRAKERWGAKKKADL